MVRAAASNSAYNALSWLGEVLAEAGPQNQNEQACLAAGIWPRALIISAQR
jgi:hypothetical protein